MNIDQKKIKMSLTHEVSDQMELGDTVHLKIEAQVVKKEVGDNQDGSVNIKYILKSLIVELWLNMPS